MEMLFFDKKVYFLWHYYLLMAQFKKVHFLSNINNNIEIKILSI